MKKELSRRAALLSHSGSGYRNVDHWFLHFILIQGVTVGTECAVIHGMERVPFRLGVLPEPAPEMRDAALRTFRARGGENYPATRKDAFGRTAC
jgi:hypothetical protein